MSQIETFEQSGLLVISETGDLTANFRQYPLVYEQDRKSRANARKLGQLFEDAIVGDTSIKLKGTSFRFNSLSLTSGQEHLLYLATSRKDRGRDIIESVSEKPAGLILAGPCMFGANSVQLINAERGSFLLTDPNNGIPGDIVFDEIQISDETHPYEEHFIQHWLNQHDLLRSLSQSSEPKLRIQIPDRQYIFYGLKLLQRGQITEGQMQEYAEAVNIRADRLKDSLLITQPNATIEFQNPLDSIDIQDWKKLAKSSPHEVLTRLAMTDDVWQSLAQNYTAATWLDLNNLSYVARYLQAMRDLQSSDKQVIALEFPEEYRILQETTDLASNLTQQLGDITCIYTLPRVLINTCNSDSGSRNYLFFANTCEGSSVTQGNKEIRKLIRRYYLKQGLVALVSSIV